MASGDPCVSCRLRERAGRVRLAAAPLPSGRHGLSREHVVRSQRLRLLGAAVAVAGTDGYAAMTVSAVLARANVSRKTFYEQFADREHCFLAASTRRSSGRWRACAPPSRSTRRGPSGCAPRLRWGLHALAANDGGGARRVRRGARRRARARSRCATARCASSPPLFAPGFDAAPAGAAIPPSMPQAIAGAFCELIATRIRARRRGAAAAAAARPAVLRARAVRRPGGRVGRARRTGCARRAGGGRSRAAAR